MMLLNLRGTSGVGKSTLARKLFEFYSDCIPQFRDGRKRPVSLLYVGALNGRSLFVLGHYDIPCGGADTIAEREYAFGLLQEARDAGYDVLWEGVVYSDEVPRTVQLCKGHEAEVIWLRTPIELCIERIKQRRSERGNEKPLNEKNTRQRQKRIENAVARIKDAGIPVSRPTDFEVAFQRAKELLKL